MNYPGPSVHVKQPTNRQKQSSKGSSGAEGMPDITHLRLAAVTTEKNERACDNFKKGLAQVQIQL